MALTYDPIAREQLDELRARLGPRYIDAIWAQRAFERDARNEQAMAGWQASYPAWNRLFEHPAMDFRARTAARRVLIEQELRDAVGLAVSRPTVAVGSFSPHGWNRAEEQVV